MRFHQRRMRHELHPVDSCGIASRKEEVVVSDKLALTGKLCGVQTYVYATAKVYAQHTYMPTWPASQQLVTRASSEPFVAHVH